LDDFLLSALELLSRDYPQDCAALTKSETSRMIALVEQVQVRDSCDILTGHPMASIRELVAYADPRPVPWAIHELEESRVWTVF
jgi:hypothetical protein